MKAARVSGNLDAPEGGFDAIMQAIACDVRHKKNVSRVGDDIIRTCLLMTLLKPCYSFRTRLKMIRVEIDCTVSAVIDH